MAHQHRAAKYRVNRLVMQVSPAVVKPVAVGAALEELCVVSHVAHCCLLAQPEKYEQDTMELMRAALALANTLVGGGVVPRTPALSSKETACRLLCPALSPYSANALHFAVPLACPLTPPHRPPSCTFPISSKSRRGFKRQASTATRGELTRREIGEQPRERAALLLLTRYRPRSTREARPPKNAGGKKKRNKISNLSRPRVCALCLRVSAATSSADGVEHHTETWVSAPQRSRRHGSEDEVELTPLLRCLL